MKIAITGGPSAGKTVIVQTILKEFSDKVAMVPESASILFKGGFPRASTPQSTLHQQIAIYRVQVELEAMIEEENPGKLIVCDRGTVDSIAYLNETDIFFSRVGTTLNKEISRYDYVFHLGSATSKNFDLTNPIRIETPNEARVIDNKIRNAWSTHPNRTIINNTSHFSKKVSHALELIREILKNSGEVK